MLGDLACSIVHATGCHSSPESVLVLHPRMTLCLAPPFPGITGNYCQDVTVTKGATYKLSYYYGRLMTQFKK
jgi:hypothetical protein